MIIHTSFSSPCPLLPATGSCYCSIPPSLPVVGWRAGLRNSALLYTPEGWNESLGFQTPLWPPRWNYSLTQDPIPRWGSFTSQDQPSSLWGSFAQPLPFLHWPQILFTSAGSCEVSWTNSPGPLHPRPYCPCCCHQPSLGCERKSHFSLLWCTQHRENSSSTVLKHCIILPVQYLLGPVNCEFLVSSGPGISLLPLNS